MDIENLLKRGAGAHEICCSSCCLVVWHWVRAAPVSWAWACGWEEPRVRNFGGYMLITTDPVAGFPQEMANETGPLTTRRSRVTQAQCRPRAPALGIKAVFRHTSPAHPRPILPCNPQSGRNTCP